MIINILIINFIIIIIIIFYFIASKTHAEKTKQKLRRINKVIKNKKQKKPNKQRIYTLTCMAIYLQILKYVTAALIPYITVLSMIYN